ncbi:MAG TPA: hypothetical protein VHB47_01465 [Thermoanaerobaculia bacterium]|nr:hypothetical protein [Thermoanaerobaculia bacterium]
MKQSIAAPPITSARAVGRWDSGAGSPAAHSPPAATAPAIAPDAAGVACPPRRRCPSTRPAQAPAARPTSTRNGTVPTVAIGTIRRAPLDAREATA